MTRLTIVAGALVLASCASGGAGNPRVPLNPAAPMRTLTTPISHVVFIIQENRSFNNLFLNYPGATTQDYGYDTYGNKIPLRKTSISTSWDISHNSKAFFTACDGQGKLPGTKCKLDGWNGENAGYGHPKNFAYAYVPEREVDQYWKMAQQYVLGDQTFSSNIDGSFIAHQYSVAAYADRAVDNPAGPWGCEGGKDDTIAQFTKKRTYGSRIVTCFDIPSIATQADRAGLSWRFYTGGVYTDGGLWSSFQAESKIYNGPDWTTNVINPPAQFLADLSGGQLANVTWITPTYETSDHPGLLARKGPSWVTSLVNAIGESKFWNSTAIFLMWDDWGGLYDPVQPPFEDYDGLGFRVPMIMISPYAKAGYVTHVQYETSSVLRYIEDNFGLAPMAASDKRANNPADDAFDYAQNPRKFKKFAGGRSSQYWLRLERSAGPTRVPQAVLGDD